MEKENKNNRVIKGLWSLTGLKSSDYISKSKQVHSDLTGSRLRGLMSGVTNSNYRQATKQDVHQCLIVICHWAGVDSTLLRKSEDINIEALLKDIDRSIVHASIDGLSEKDRVKKVLEKMF